MRQNLQRDALRGNSFQKGGYCNEEKNRDINGSYISYLYGFGGM